MNGHTIANAFDWTVVGISGFLVGVCTLSGLYAIPWASFRRRNTGRAVAKEFNFLWRTRIFVCVSAALFATSQVLRLQVLWGPYSTLLPGGWATAILCRVYIASASGLFMPLYLLTALFSCIFALSSRDPRYPNTSIVAFAIGFTVPTCAAQAFCAMFTVIIQSLDYNDWLPYVLFAPFDDGQDVSCPPNSSNCAFCIFPLLSTVTLAGFGFFYLVVLCVVSHKLSRTAVNRSLVTRVRIMQCFIAALFVGDLACRGTTILFHPFQLAFELLRLGIVLCDGAMVLTVVYFMIVKPVYDTRVAEKWLEIEQPLQSSYELVPLVNDRRGQESDYDAA